MKVGIIGLGKMGMSLAKNMLSKGIDVIAYDQSSESIINAKKNHIPIFENISDLVDNLPKQKIIWMMVPAGDTVDQVLNSICPLLSPQDILIDGGNSHFKDSIRRSLKLKESSGLYYFDCGTSGGVEGALLGGNFMIGGPSEAFGQIEEIFEKIATKDGYLYTGDSGSGHYLKMIHNGIEYGMMQSIGEGFEMLESSSYNYNNVDVARLWNSGSVIRSWLMELTEEAFRKEEKLESIKGVINSSGEGQWTVQEALENKISIPTITASLMARYRSLNEDTFSGKVVSALRNEFGGHEVYKNKT